MTRETLFEAIGTIDERFVAEAGKTPKKPLLWLKITAAAASLALIAAGGTLAYSYMQDPPPVTTQPPMVGYDNACVVTPTTTTTTVPYALITTMSPSKRPEPFVVTYPDTEDRVIAESHLTGNDLGQYSRPELGECIIDVMDPAISGNTDPNTVYWLELRMFDENGQLSNERRRSEAERLALIGYEVFLREESYTDYWGEEQHKTDLCGFFTKEHLETFPADDSIGYILDFCDDDVSEYLRVNVIQTENGPITAILYPEVTDTFGFDATE